MSTANADAKTAGSNCDPPPISPGLNSFGGGVSTKNVHYSVSHYSEQRRTYALMDLRGLLGFNVQRLRRERKLSQEQLSFLAGRTRAYISGLEAGRRNATLETIATLAQALGVEPHELIESKAARERRETLQLYKQ